MLFVSRSDEERSSLDDEEDEDANDGAGKNMKKRTQKRAERMQKEGAEERQERCRRETRKMQKRTRRTQKRTRRTQKRTRRVQKRTRRRCVGSWAVRGGRQDGGGGTGEQGVAEAAPSTACGGPFAA
jgi:hypothetical protein